MICLLCDMALLPQKATVPTVAPPHLANAFTRALVLWPPLVAACTGVLTHTEKGREERECLVFSFL